MAISNSLTSMTPFLDKPGRENRRCAGPSPASVKIFTHIPTCAWGSVDKTDRSHALICVVVRAPRMYRMGYQGYQCPCQHTGEGKEIKKMNPEYLVRSTVA
jgi:hypothetical protein